MAILRYGQSKLLLRAVTAGLASASCVMLYFNPEWAGLELWTIIFADGLGHSVLAPAAAAFFALLGWRAASLAFGDLAAVEATEGALKITTFWRSTSIEWRDLLEVKIERKRVKYWLQYRLVLRAVSDGLSDTKTVRLPLGMTELPKAKFAGLVEQIEAYRDKATGIVGRAGAGPRDAANDFDADAALERYLAKKAPNVLAAEPSEDERGDFDADEALARYMERKAIDPASVVPAPSPAVAAAAARPGFGRKGL